MDWRCRVARGVDERSEFFAHGATERKQPYDIVPRHANLFHQRRLLLQALRMAFLGEEDVVHQSPDIIEVALALNGSIERGRRVILEPLFPLGALAAGIDKQLLDAQGKGHASISHGRLAIQTIPLEYIAALHWWRESTDVSCMRRGCSASGQLPTATFYQEHLLCDLSTRNAHGGEVPAGEERRLRSD